MEGFGYEAAVCMCVRERESVSRVRLFVTPRTVALQTPVHWILQAGILEWVAVPFSRGSAGSKD